jgi:hypothetical protein
MVPTEVLNRGFHCVMKFWLMQSCVLAYTMSPLLPQISLGMLLLDLVFSSGLNFKCLQVLYFLQGERLCNFYCCAVIAGAEALARRCPKLKSFISKGCRQINDRAVSCLARHCHNLEVINLHGCTVSYVVSAAATCFGCPFAFVLFSVRVKDRLYKRS